MRKEIRTLRRRTLFLFFVLLLAAIAVLAVLVLSIERDSNASKSGAIISRARVNDDTEVTVTEISNSDYNKVYDLISAELRRYPSSILSGVSIRIAGIISSQGVLASGFLRGETVWISVVDPRDSKSRKDDQMVWVLHHEIGTLIAARFGTQSEANAWGGLLPDGVHYAMSEALAIQLGWNSQITSEKLYDNGFVTQYAQASIDNDFSEVAAMLMTKKSVLEALSIKYWRIFGKKNIVHTMYARLGIDLDSSFVK